jgi:guanylate kinase
MFVTAPDAKTLYDRLTNRGTESSEVVAARMSRACEESEGIENYDYLVINDTVERAVQQIDQLIVSEQCGESEKNQGARVSANIDFINKIREELKCFSKGE